LLVVCLLAIGFCFRFAFDSVELFLASTFCFLLLLTQFRLGLGLFACHFHFEGDALHGLATQENLLIGAGPGFPSAFGFYDRVVSIVLAGLIAQIVFRTFPRFLLLFCPGGARDARNRLAIDGLVSLSHQLDLLTLWLERYHVAQDATGNESRNQHQ